MSAIQERLQLSRTPLDTWSKREQLCLASAVSCSGDQNWISVSRTLKTVCGVNGNGNGNNSNTNNNNRPADWYSQKNCAVQYGHLLESVETTKRKKRTSESSVSSPATVEPPTELLLRRLTEERLQEIKAQMRSDVDMYRKVQIEIEALQSDEMTEKELQGMWQEIEKAQEAKRIEEMTMENRLREREQRKKELAVNWRQGKRSTPVTPDTNTTAVDMEVEQQQPPTSSAAPSPLLTSLLSSTSTVATSTTTTSATGSVARTTAPTITSLLTSGPTSIPNQPAIKGDPALMARPISGPPGSESLASSMPTTPGKSPSQAAPTLSMLLEQKNKGTPPTKVNIDIKSIVEDRNSVNSESVSAAAADAAAADAGGDETDPNEEQLLEVFQNIIMNDIDIDMASVIEDEILKNVENVDTTSPGNAKPEEVIDFEDKLDALKREQTTKESEEAKPVEVVIGSSDDSNDNIPLATVATHESKDREQPISEENTKVEEPSNSATEPLPNETVVEEINETITLISSSSEDTTDVPPAISEFKKEDPLQESKKEEHIEKEKEEKKSLEVLTNDPEEAEASASNQESNTPAETSKSTEEKPNLCQLSLTDEESSLLADSSKQEDTPRNARPNKQQQQPPAATKSVGAEEQSKAEIVDPSPQPPSAPARTPLLRKLPHRDRSESPMVDDDTTTASDHSTARSSTRRRCSSTPVIDSIPNSPASSEHNPTDDRRETRAASKKLFLSIYSTLLDSKHSTPFRRPFQDEHAQRHAELCLRPVDLPSIKRNIDSGVIRSIGELHRDVLLMTQNVLVAYKPHTTQHKTAQLFWTDCQTIKEFGAHQMETPAPTVAHNTVTSTSSSSVTASSSSTSSSKADKDKEKPSANKARSGSRKSQRHH